MTTAFNINGIEPLLEVYDLPTSIAFYRDVLGFELIAGDASWWCRLRSGDVTLMLNTAYDPGERPEEPEPERVRSHADTSLYFSSADPLEMHKHLHAMGWPVTDPEVTSYGMKQVTTKDPNGFQLVFMCPVEPR